MWTGAGSLGQRRTSCGTAPNGRLATFSVRWPRLRNARHEVCLFFLVSRLSQSPLPGGTIMYRSILVPLDGSAFAEHALPLALSIARRSKATLQLAHVDLVPSS